MQVAPLCRILGLLFLILSLSFLPPILIAAGYHDHTEAFVYSFMITFLIGNLLWIPTRKQLTAPNIQDGFFLIVLFWIISGLFSALPFYLEKNLHLSFINALFESISGLTTTGATVLTQIDSLPRAIVYYRQQLQFLGGISIILLAIAILPTLGIGGLQLFRSEVSSFSKEDKFTPKVRFAAKNIWFIYLLLTALCTLGYYFAGMTWFDAIGHSFSTVSTGGFSTHEANLAYFASTKINFIAIVFMFLGSINFMLHFIALKRHTLNPYRDNPECRFFIYFLLMITLVSFVFLALFNRPDTFSRMDVFVEIMSFTTTTGFNVTPHALPNFMAFLLLFCAFVGGCAGSTSGGIKIFRLMLLHKIGIREVHRLIHPHGQYVIKLGNQGINTRTIEGVWGFFALYFFVFVLLLLLLLIVEKDFLSTYSALMAAITNTGRGLGEVATCFNSLSSYSKAILCFAMIAGRLEILAILVLFSPVFWRR